MHSVDPSNDAVQGRLGNAARQLVTGVGGPRKYEHSQEETEAPFRSSEVNHQVRACFSWLLGSREGVGIPRAVHDIDKRLIDLPLERHATTTGRQASLAEAW